MLPQFGIAKLVNITLISLWFMVHISILTLIYKPTNITGGAPPCGSIIWENQQKDESEQYHVESCTLLDGMQKQIKVLLGSVHIYPLSPIKTTARYEFVAMLRFDQLHQKQLHPDKKNGANPHLTRYILYWIYIYIYRSKMIFLDANGSF